MTVLVAGGTGALGGAVVAELLDAGYEVAATWIADRERERLADRPVELIRADLLDPDDAAAAVRAVDGLEAVVNLVGGFAMGPRVGDDEASLADFETMLRLNLVPGFNLAHAAMPILVERGGGAYVGVAAKAALRPFAGAAGYITAKAAVLAFVQALDAEYRGDGVRANAILPSTIDTPANRASQPDADFSNWVAPADIARVVRFLVSGDSAVTAGAAVPVYGRA